MRNIHTLSELIIVCIYRDLCVDTKWQICLHHILVLQRRRALVSIPRVTTWHAELIRP